MRTVRFSDLKKVLWASMLMPLFMSCQKNAITGRNQLLILGEGDVQKLANTQYRDFLNKNPVVGQGSTRDQMMVTSVGNRLAVAVTQYADEMGKADLLKGYNWEFNLVNKNEVNAWCMPGGKVVVYTGLLPVAQNEASLAVVMGHEVAHAIARHGNERMSQGLVQQLGGVALAVAVMDKPYETQQLFLAAYGVGTSVAGILPFSRKHELEADRFGLIFAAKAGYDPREAEGFWTRMARANSGAKPPEFLSTHPSDDTRIRKVREYAEEAMKYYRPAAPQP
jgi:predicted Zn-dependent protease